MDINVRVTLDAGPTFAPLANALAGLIAQAAQQPTGLTKAFEVSEPPEFRKDEKPSRAVEGETEEAAKPKPTRTRPSRAATKETEVEGEHVPVPVPEPVPDHVLVEGKKPTATAKAEELSDEDKLDAIRARVTQGVKDGRGTDIRALLEAFGSRRASDLQSNQFEAFDGCLSLLEAGENVADIIKGRA